MRRSSYLSLAAMVFLLLAMASMEAEAIRLDAETRASVNSSGNQMALNKPNETAVKGPASSISETQRSVHVGENEAVRAVAHKLPEFHEDYYGATHHSSRHH